MQPPIRVLFELLAADVEAHTKQIAQGVHKALPLEAVAHLGRAEHQAIEVAIRDGLRAMVWQSLCHFDNVGCHLPPEILGYRISATPAAGTQAPHDIRVGEQDYSDTWLRFVSERDA